MINNFFSENRAVYDNVEKYGAATRPHERWIMDK